VGTTLLWLPVTHLGYTANDQHPAIHGLHYYVKVQTIIWQAVLKAWHLWNHYLHPPNHDQDDKTLLCTIIHQLIHDAKQDPLLHNTVAQAKTELILA